VARLEKVLATNPDNFLVQALLGRVLDQQGRKAEAEAALRKAVQIAPSVPGTHIELANHFLAHQDHKAALEALDAGLATLPENPQLILLQAEVHRRNGATDQAIARYDALLAKHPGEELAANNLASLLLDTRSDKASMERALELAKRFENSDNAAFIDTLGWAHFRLGQYEAAAGLLRKAAEKAPQVAVFQYHLGMALLKKGETEAGKSHLRKAVEAKAEFPGKEEARSALAQG
jgi:predicted Zn-dependent protease